MVKFLPNRIFLILPPPNSTLHDQLVVKNYRATKARHISRKLPTSSAPSACIAATCDLRISEPAQVGTLPLQDRFAAASGSGPPCRCSLPAESWDRASLTETDSCSRRSA